MAPATDPADGPTPRAPGLPAPRPIPAGHRRSGGMRPAGSHLAITGRRRLQLRALTVLWAVVVGVFWFWWLQPEHRISTPLFILNGLPMLYVTTVLPSFYWHFVIRARIPDPLPAPAGVRVAVITPCVPSSESLDVVETQMRALAELTYPCDTWVLDEGNNPEIAAIAARHGVRHFSRLGVEAWNQPGPPFQAKTKAGNVNAWIDHVLREGRNYDVFVQLDIDHRPVADYLERTLGYFDDPSVAWVQAPSVAGNLHHWTARGQAEQDTVLQGPLQMGFYGKSSTPFIIGSHTTYRMSAIVEIGGYQPTRAEDHLDTVVLASHGYRGVYVPELIAVGDGPETFATYLGQQFAWAYSMVQIFFFHTPKLLRHYRPGQAFQFVMAQSWYTLWSLSCAVLWLLPFQALLTGTVMTNVVLSEFFLRYLPLILAATLMWWWSRSLFRPLSVLLTWRAIVLEAARWPIVLWAIVNVVLRVKRPYMITPKGAGAGDVVPGNRVYGPYFAMAWLGLAVIAGYTLLGGSTPADGYLWLALLNSATMLAVVAVSALIDVHDIRVRRGGPREVMRLRAGTLWLLTASLLALAGCVVASADLLDVAFA